MAVATRPPNLIRRVLDPAGSLVQEPLERVAALVALAGGTGAILLCIPHGRFGMVAVVLFFPVSAWRHRLALKLGLTMDDSGPRWFDLASVGIVLLAFALLLVVPTGYRDWLFGLLFGSLLPFTFVVSTRQISRQAARRVP